MIKATLTSLDDVERVASIIKAACFIQFLLAGLDYILYVSYGENSSKLIFVFLAICQVVMAIVGLISALQYIVKGALAYFAYHASRFVFFGFYAIYISSINESDDAWRDYRSVAIGIAWAILGLTVIYTALAFQFWRILQKKGPPPKQMASADNTFTVEIYGDEEDTHIGEEIELDVEDSDPSIRGLQL